MLIDSIKVEEFLKILETMPNNNLTFRINEKFAENLRGRTIMEFLYCGTEEQCFAVGEIKSFEMSFAKDLKYFDTAEFRGCQNVMVIINTNIGKYTIDCLWHHNESRRDGSRIFLIPSTPRFSDTAISATTRERSPVFLKISATK